MKDFIDRQAIKDLHARECVHNCYYCKHFKYNKTYLKATCDLLDMVNGIQLENDLKERSETELQNKWIPVTYRPMDDEEIKDYCERLAIPEDTLEDWEKRMFNCRLPEDGQEILISTAWGVRSDICGWDEYGCGLEGNGDWDGVDAWMPMPNAYKKDGDEE